MAGYFSYFPKIFYTFDKDTLNNQAVTNIFARSTFIRNIANNSSVYFKYQIQDSDTPEVIAHKIYGDPYRSWIVLLFNSYINPSYEFPLKEDSLNDYIVNKYKQTVLDAKQTIHHYEKEITKILSHNGIEVSKEINKYQLSDKELNYRTNVLSNTALPDVADTSISVGTERLYLGHAKFLTMITTHRAVSNYTYELIENENRREIRLLDPVYVSQIENEFKQLMSNG